MLSVGTSCTVQSLKARPELNGRRGVVVSKLDEGGRVGVQVEGEDKPLSLKPANLDVVSADSAVQSVDSKTLNTHSHAPPIPSREWTASIIS